MARRQRPKITGVTVYKRGSTWSYRLEVGADPVTGERQRDNKGGFDSEDAAWKAALDSRSRLEQGRHVKPSHRKVAEFLDEWLVVVLDAVKPSTYQYYVDYIEAYVKPTIGKRCLQEITVPVLNMLYRRLLASGRSKPDNNTKMYAYSGRNRPKPWTLDELAAWLRVALDNRFAGMWVLAATTGLRRSELAGVERDMLDLDRGTLTVENTRVVVRGHAPTRTGRPRVAAA